MRIYNYAFNTGLFLNEDMADESPLEPGVFLLPANATTQPPLPAQEGSTVNFENGDWVYKAIPQPEPEPEPVPLTYAQLRALEYPSLLDYIDGVVKGDQAQIDKYIADCLAVKVKYPKE